MDKKRITIIVLSTAVVLGGAYMGYEMFPANGQLVPTETMAIPLPTLCEPAQKEWVQCTIEFEAGKGEKEVCTKVQAPDKVPCAGSVAATRRVGVTVITPTGERFGAPMDEDEKAKAEDLSKIDYQFDARAGNTLPPGTDPDNVQEEVYYERLLGNTNYVYVWDDEVLSDYGSAHVSFLSSITEDVVAKWFETPAILRRLRFVYKTAINEGIAPEHLITKYAIESQCGKLAHKVSNANARGHWQFIPASQARVGLRNPSDLVQSTYAMLRLRNAHLEDMKRIAPQCYEQYKDRKDAASLYILHNAGGLGAAVAYGCTAASKTVLRNFRNNMPKALSRLPDEKIPEAYRNAWEVKTSEIASWVKRYLFKLES